MPGTPSRTASSGAAHGKPPVRPTPRREEFKVGKGTSAVRQPMPEAEARANPVKPHRLRLWAVELTAEDLAAHAALMARIHLAQKHGVPFVLRSAKQISLYITGTERLRRRVYELNKHRFPIIREGGFLSMRVDTYEQWLKEQEDESLGRPRH